MVMAARASATTEDASGRSVGARSPPQAVIIVAARAGAIRRAMGAGYRAEPDPRSA